MQVQRQLVVHQINWGSTKKSVRFEIPAVKNPDGSKITKTVEITVLKDKVMEHGIQISLIRMMMEMDTLYRETAKGLDPKTSHSIPAGMITPAEFVKYY